MVDLKLQLPPNYLKEEVRCEFVIDRKRKEIWAVELDLLSEFDRVCKKYGLRYSAEGGTLLGAIRHKGFIPWDDDIDIAMPRADYKKFEEIAGKEFCYPYFWQTEETESGTMRGHGQLRNSETTAILTLEKGKNIQFNQGIFIDIIPFDNIPDSEGEMLKQYNKIVKLKKKARFYADMSIHFSPEYKYSKNEIKNLLKKKVLHPIISTYCNWFNYQKVYGQFEKLCEKYNCITTRRIADLCLPVGIERMQRKSTDFDNLEYADFEFLKIPIYKNWKENLTISYGEDFMVFKKGGTEHGGLIFDTNKSYMTYLK